MSDPKRPPSSASSEPPAAKKAKGEWDLPVSAQAARTFNPIRAIVDTLKIPSNPPRPLIRLSIGDPTVFGNMRTPPEAEAAVRAALEGGASNGYGPSTGLPDARAAIAKKESRGGRTVEPGDVVIASGCSGAIALVLPTLANPGDNVLVPRPGFSLYGTVCDNAGVEARHYELLPERGWEADVAAMDALVDGRTRALLINNPSNPCGSNFSEAHLRELVAFAARHRLPVVADEIYADMVFAGQRFVSAAEVSDEAPVLVLGGLAKQYLVPGWRVGWVVVHDRHGRAAALRDGLVTMSQVILGANSLVQAAIPAMLDGTPPAYYEALNKQLEEQATFFADRCEAIPGLRVVRPQGAMYIMVGIDTAALDGVADDRAFTQMLMDEEQVFVLPGSCFGAPNFFRVVVCPPVPVLSDACDRIASFMARHLRK